MLRQRLATSVLIGVILAVTGGCGSERGPNGPSTTAADPVLSTKSDPERVRSADVSILFVGNSHTTSFGLPALVGDMIRFRDPRKTVYSHVVSVAFLEDVASNPECREEIESRPWKYVVLQAQKESRSGKVKYSQTEGIEIAKLAKERGASAVFCAEWGLQNVAGHGSRIEAGYDEMAKASGARVAPIGRAWDLALAERPEMPLYSPDGNHQSALGAFLTASVLFGVLTGESPASLADFPYEGASKADRKFLSATAANALARSSANPKPR